MEDLPDELLEHILSLVSPYQDLDSCKLVSRKWCNAVKRVVRRKRCSLYNAIKNSTIKWEYGDCSGMSFRHSHAACCYDGFMYVYGGFSKTSTSFNDLTALNLTKRTWTRILSGGSFPSPKAGASLCAYNNKLILYGGCAQPSNMHPFQPLLVFGELHIFDIDKRIWTCWPNNGSKDPTTSHSVTVHRNMMVTFGGLIYLPSNRLNMTNDLCCLNLDTFTWSTPKCSAVKPPPMAGHSQIYLDEDHLIVIGGRDSAGYPRTPCDGAWLLTMGEEPWQWRNLSDENSQWMPPRLWYHPVTRVGDCLVAFSRCNERDPSQNPRDPPENVGGGGNAARQVPDQNVNGKRGELHRHLPQPDNSPLSVGPGPLHPLPRTERRKQQLALLEKFKKRYTKEKPIEPESLPSMNLYVADIRNVVESGRVTWQEPRYSPGCPSDRILYTLLVGNSELIMLGGLVAPLAGEEDRDPEMADIHTLAFARPPRFFL